MYEIRVCWIISVAPFEKKDVIKSQYTVEYITRSYYATVQGRLDKMVKVTEAAINQVKEEVQFMIDQGEQPIIRLSMGVG